MRIGIPRELKPLEGRVGLIPAACAGLVKEGHTVMVEAGAGMKSGYSDDDYRAVGVDVRLVGELELKGELVANLHNAFEIVQAKGVGGAHRGDDVRWGSL